jgi:hypothetical protein
LIVTVVQRDEPVYACTLQASVVDDVHAVLLHASDIVSAAVDVKLVPPKLRPLSVTMPLAVSPELAAWLELTTGAARATLSKRTGNARSCGTDSLNTVEAKVRSASA